MKSEQLRMLWEVFMASEFERFTEVLARDGRLEEASRVDGIRGEMRQIVYTDPEDV